MPNKIDVLINNIGYASLIFSNTYLIDEKGKILRKYQLNHLNIPTEKEKLFKLLLRRGILLGTTVMFKKELLAMLLPIPRGIDFDRWVALIATKMNGVKYLDKPLVYYRQHQNNASGRTKTFSFAEKIIAFVLDREESQKRMHLKMGACSRIKNLIKNSLFNESERKYLKEVLEYYNAFIERKPMKTIAIEIKNRHEWYPSSNFRIILEKWAWILLPLLDVY
ncbi:MAG: hypothetical protein ACFFBD_14710, partial [Candidatus Hodarchaeota archaeon]